MIEAFLYTISINRPAGSIASSSQTFQERSACRILVLMWKTREELELYSTDETAKESKRFSGHPDSNQGPKDIYVTLQSSALPAEL
ncbi:uncharacterized protein VTP21DRAFT_8989 [Calcarisporiella thermophila]|uniref:uncharacterized protein n=1 Tax=Calcarisporiella thermophila TaxID=911321 RepID=UPI003743E2A0